MSDIAISKSLDVPWILRETLLKSEISLLVSTSALVALGIAIGITILGTGTGTHESLKWWIETPGRVVTTLRNVARALLPPIVPDDLDFRRDDDLDSAFELVDFNMAPIYSSDPQEQEAQAGTPTEATE